MTTVYARELFDLQASFAHRAAALSGRPLDEVLLDYTNFYVRFGLGRDFDPCNEGWQRYLSGALGAEDLGAFSHRFYMREPEVATAPQVVATFGCFSYARRGSECLRLHFSNGEAPGRSPLSRDRAERRRAELRALFGHVQQSSGEDLPVVGVSWLYNLEAYRRLFPRAYTTSAEVVRDRFRSMPLWGQFADRSGGVRPPVARQFEQRLSEASNTASLNDCFPLPVLSVRAPLSEFYAFYNP